MKAHELRPNTGAHRLRRRVGRGDGSGRGSYSTHGMKGQKARSGGSIRRGFEGGQIAMIKGMPMLRGFTNVFREEYLEVNLEKLSALPKGTNVTPELLKSLGIIRNSKQKIKVLGRGAINQALTVAAHKFSKSARAAIVAAGGTTEDLVK